MAVCLQTVYSPVHHIKGANDMSKTLRICSTLLGATLAGCGATTTAAAAPAAPSHARATHHHFNRTDFRHFGAGGASFFTTLSQLTKLSTSTIQQDMKKGESMAVIAQSAGISQTTLITALEASDKTQMQKLVSSGHLTQSAANTQISRYDASLPTMVTRKGGFFHHPYKGNYSPS